MTHLCATARPNLIMILTDEHNMRTLGCYREYFKSQNQTEQAYIWGEELEVETPNIDRLASEGALYTNFISVLPICTPSRASFMSGLYPHKTGAIDNHEAINDNIVTFAEVLKSQRDYYTGYFGKWHLNGEERPGWSNNTTKFGFEDTKYQYNRGHWKFLDEVNGQMEGYTIDDKQKFEGKEDKHFTTDYLFDRGIESMKRAKERDQPFAFVLSIPDPHGPDKVRQPYEDMYKHMNFNLPLTAKKAVRRNPAPPKWNNHDHVGVPLSEANSYLKEYEEKYVFQNNMRQYFGMVKCIDDNVGKLLTYLDNEGINEETVVM
jgi:arylsulfatase A-like enzyme